MSDNDQQKYKITVKHDNITYLLDLKEKTATIYTIDIEKCDILLIPRTINYESTEYVIKSILQNAFFRKQIKSVQFSSDSEIHSIETLAFCYSFVESISLPSSIVELKERWCQNCHKLSQIKIDPNNPRYKVYEEKFIIEKSSTESDNFDVLNLSFQKLDTITIPSFIKRIGKYAFENCKELRTIEFEANSQIQTIEKNAFYQSSIESLMIPPSLIELKKGWCNEVEKLVDIKICSDNPMYSFYDEKFIIGKSSIESENFDVLVFCVRDIEEATIPSFIKHIGPFSFQRCEDLMTIEFEANSELQTIEKRAFEYSTIEDIKIPIHTTLIGERSFNRCENIQTFDIPENSKLEIIEKYAFWNSSIESLAIPSNLIELKENCLFLATKLSRVTVSPNNKNFITFDDKMIIKKSSIDSENFDFLVFNAHDRKIVKMPSFIKHIGPFVFALNTKLKKVEIPINSELQTIEEYAFNQSSIEYIYIPSHLKRISKSAFYLCGYLRNVEIAKNSELEIIEGHGFAYSSIVSFSIPSHLTQIGELAFHMCDILKKIEISSNSELKVIEKKAFYESGITSFSITSKVEQIGTNAFASCKKLQIIEIDENSKIDSINRDLFNKSFQVVIMIPTKLSDYLKF